MSLYKKLAYHLDQSHCGYFTYFEVVRTRGFLRINFHNRSVEELNKTILFRPRHLLIELSVGIGIEAIYLILRWDFEDIIRK